MPRAITPGVSVTASGCDRDVERVDRASDRARGCRWRAACPRTMPRTEPTRPKSSPSARNAREDLPRRGADGLQHADVLAAAQDRDQHGVVDEEHPHQQRHAGEREEVHAERAQHLLDALVAARRPLDARAGRQLRCARASASRRAASDRCARAFPCMPKLRCAVAMSQTAMLPLNAVAGPSRLEQAAHDERARGGRGCSASTRRRCARPRSRANGAGRISASGRKSAKYCRRARRSSRRSRCARSGSRGSADR